MLHIYIYIYIYTLSYIYIILTQYANPVITTMGLWQLVYLGINRQTVHGRAQVHQLP